MGQLRFQLTVAPGIGFYITWSDQEIAVALPLLIFYFGITKKAHGYDILGIWGNKK